jgi:hypothetical protein
MGRNPVGSCGIGGGAGGLETGACDQAVAAATSHTTMPVLKSFITKILKHGSYHHAYY